MHRIFVTDPFDHLSKFDRLQKEAKWQPPWNTSSDEKMPWSVARTTCDITRKLTDTSGAT